jgi:hypothetical protein
MNIVDERGHIGKEEERGSDAKMSHVCGYGVRSGPPESLPQSRHLACNRRYEVNDTYSTAHLLPFI